jgi:hypothetical protein
MNVKILCLRRKITAVLQLKASCVEIYPQALPQNG